MITIRQPKLISTLSPEILKILWVKQLWSRSLSEICHLCTTSSNNIFQCVSLYSDLFSELIFWVFETFHSSHYCVTTTRYLIPGYTDSLYSVADRLLSLHNSSQWVFIIFFLKMSLHLSSLNCRDLWKSFWMDIEREMSSLNWWTSSENLKNCLQSYSSFNKYIHIDTHP